MLIVLQQGALVFRIEGTELEVEMFGVKNKHDKVDILETIVNESYNYNKEECPALLELIQVSDTIEGLSVEEKDLLAHISIDKILSRLGLEDNNILEILRNIAIGDSSYFICKAIVDNTEVVSTSNIFYRLRELGELNGISNNKSTKDIILELVENTPPAMFENPSVLKSVYKLTESLSVIGGILNANINNRR